jgi:hypothetical protein
VRNFDQTDSRIVDIDVSIVTEVILGSRMEDWRIARISLFAPVLNRAMFFLSSPSPSGFAFENKPKKLAFCEHCSGTGYEMTDLD